MIVPDLNVLLYAHVDAFPFHSAARAWWEGAVRGTEEIGIPGVVVFGFVRIATNRRVFETPMGVDAATATVERWLSHPHIHLLVPGARHLDLAFGLLRAARTSADLSTDVQIAALAIENGGTVYSHDADFDSFAGLRRVDPVPRPSRRR